MTDTQKTSTQNEISTYLEYAHLQIAAEAFIKGSRGKTFDIGKNEDKKESEGEKLAKDLIEGNWHSSKFSKTLADEFVKRWKVVRHIGNTGTGFSGTLFEAIADNPAAGIKEGQQVLSFRSTEFVDDAVRDSRATNELEIADKGFAFGQISDMKEWIDELRRDGAMKDHITVTGYSLGGHLAIHGEEAA
jgi:hemolysin-type calcium-binding region